MNEVNALKYNGLRVLAIGAEPVEMATNMFPGATIDVARLKPSKRQVGYSAILSDSSLVNIHFSKAMSYIRQLRDSLVQEGELHLFVPSLEWTAEQVLAQTSSPALLQHIHGYKDYPRLSSYTMQDLRSILYSVSMGVQHARQGKYMIGEHEAGINYVMAVKLGTEQK